MLKRLLVGISLFLCMAFVAGCGGDDDDMVDGGNVMVDARTADAATSSGAFLQACTGTGQGTCQTGLTCFPFNNDGPHCTRACTPANAATVCAPSTLGCSGMGVCKVR